MDNPETTKDVFHTLQGEDWLKMFRSVRHAKEPNEIQEQIKAKVQALRAGEGNTSSNLQLPDSSHPEQSVRKVIATVDVEEGPTSVPVQ